MRYFCAAAMVGALAATAAASADLLSHDELFDTSNLLAGGVLPPTVPQAAIALVSQHSSSSAAASAARRSAGMEKRFLSPGAPKARRNFALEAASAAFEEAERKRDLSALEARSDEDDCEDEDDSDDDDDDGDDEDCDEDDDDDEGNDGASATYKVALAEVTSSASPSPASTASSTSGSSPAKATANPSNLADNSYTVQEGCIRFHTVLDGEVCLGVLDGSKDLGLTLDEFYCYNPSLNEDCTNLQAGAAYCTGYSSS